MPNATDAAAVSKSLTAADRLAAARTTVLQRDVPHVHPRAPELRATIVRVDRAPHDRRVEADS